MSNPFKVGPSSTRIFAGFKLPAMDVTDFHQQLGDKFMPGTPYMQAPMGLNAYLPAVLDIPALSEQLDEDHAAVLPDEVALIIYASTEIYYTARDLSLRRKIYTDSHWAVFNMDAPGGGGFFPGPACRPSQRGTRLSWYLFDTLIDWQSGFSQLLFAVPERIGQGNVRALLSHTTAQSQALADAGTNQVIVMASPDYAVIWTHAETEMKLFGKGLLDASYSRVLREFVAEAKDMPFLEEDMSQHITINGITIDGPSMFTFRFRRDRRFL